MKNLFLYFLFICTFNAFSQTGRVGQDFIDAIEKEGMTVYYYKGKKKKESHVKPKGFPEHKSIIYDGKNVQMILMSWSSYSHVPFVGNSNFMKTVTSEMCVLYAKKIDEDFFTYIAFFPKKKSDATLITPFKKHAAIYLSDYAELAEKVSKKEKGYTRLDAIQVIEEYDNWLEANK